MTKDLKEGWSEERMSSNVKRFRRLEKVYVQGPANIQAWLERKVYVAEWCKKKLEK